MTVAGVARSTRSVPGLVVCISAENSGTVVALDGNADLAALPLLMDVFADVIAEHEGTVAVDLTRTEFLDTAIIRAVGVAAQYLNEHGRPLSLRSPSSLVASMLEVVGFSALVETGEREEM